MKPLTRIGFKRVINKTKPLAKGMARTFAECKICGQKAYYDYVPYSLSTPIMLTKCGHFPYKENYRTF